MRLFNVILILTLFYGTSLASRNFTMFIKSIKDEVNGIIKGLVNYVPTAEELIDLNKQLMLGYPFGLVMNSINFLCSAALSESAINSLIRPDINRIKFQLRTRCNRYSYPMLEAENLWQSPEFDPTKKVVIMVSGWTTTVNTTETLDVIADAYNCRNDYNFIALDHSFYLKALYTWSSNHTQTIGYHIASGLEHLLKIVPLENIHLVGHSLGAHIVGAAARYFTEFTGQTLKRITGLDPANPCFNEGEALAGIFRGDAEFVDIIHSSPGVVGQRGPLGDVDFYPGGILPLTPGCYNVVCSHNRVCSYYAESVYPDNDQNFIATRCSSLKALKDGKCKGRRIAMGYAVPHNAKGDFFLDVNKRKPYGKMPIIRTL